MKNIEKYCKWKAASILKAIKQGVDPPRGHPKENLTGPQKLDEESKEEASEMFPQNVGSGVPPQSAYEKDIATEERFEKLKMQTDASAIGQVPTPNQPFVPPTFPPTEPVGFQPPSKPVEPPPFVPPVQQQPPFVPPVQEPPPFVPPKQEPLAQPTIVSEPKPNPIVISQPVGGKLSKNNPKYYQIIAQAAKAANIAANELEFYKIANAKKYLMDALEKANMLEE